MAVFDQEGYGRRLRAARHLRGYDRIGDFLRDMKKLTAVELSERSAYAIERGEQPPTLDFFAAAMLTLDMPLSYFSEDVADALQERWLRLVS